MATTSEKEKKNNKNTGELAEKPSRQKEQTFTKSQIVKSEKYGHRQDALNALLDDKSTYTSAEVDNILKKFEGKGGRK